MLGAAYIALRWIEAAGLWLGKVWGEYLGALSGGIYIPFEMLHLIHAPSLMNGFIVLLNVTIVGYLVYVLFDRKYQHAQAD